MSKKRLDHDDRISLQAGMAKGLSLRDVASMLKKAILTITYPEFRFQFGYLISKHCTSQEKVDTRGTPFSHGPYLFCTMAGSFGFQYRSLYWAGVR